MTDRLIEAVDARLERSLRGVLDARDPGAAPYGLRARVDLIPDAVEPARANVRRAATSLLAIAAVILIAVAVVPVARIGDAGPAAVPEATPAPSFDIDAEGYGVVPYVDISPIAFVIVGIALTGLVAAIVVARRRRRVLVAVVGITLVVTGGLSFLALSPEPIQGSITGAGEHTTWAEVPPGFSEDEMLYVTAGPSEHYSYAVSLRNRGPLPITIEALAEDSGLSDTIPRLTAVWVDGAPPGGVTGPATPLANHRLEPGAEVVLWLVSKASSCAIGPSWDPAAPGETTGLASQSMTVRWSVLGWPRQDFLSLPFTVYEPADCPG
jgi:hypothetical protein